MSKMIGAVAKDLWGEGRWRVFCLDRAHENPSHPGHFHPRWFKSKDRAEKCADAHNKQYHADPSATPIRGSK